MIKYLDPGSSSDPIFTHELRKRARSLAMGENDKMLITGSSGFVGHKLMQTLKNAEAAPSFRMITEEGIRKLVAESEAGIIVHTAAISDIGQCSKDPEGSYRANVLIPVWLAKACRESGGRKLICFSSDQVYSGCNEEGPFVEAITRPGNLYAKEKLEMEDRVLDLCPDAVMLRAEWMYDHVSPKGNFYLNFLSSQGEFQASSKQYRGIAYVKEVAENMPACSRLPGGAYNFGSETKQSMYEIASDFARYLGKDIRIVDMPPRPNLWMNCSKAASHGVVFSDVLEGLKCCSNDAKMV